MDERVLKAREAWVMSHLVVIPELLSLMRESVLTSVAAGTTEFVGSGFESKAPLNLDPADRADLLWSHLCDFTDIVATRIGEPNPIQTTEHRIRARASHEVYIASEAIVNWLLRAIYRIVTDDHIAEYFQREVHVVSVVRDTQRGYQLETRPLPARFRCGVCGVFALVVSFSESGEPEGFECSDCGHSGEV